MSILTEYYYLLHKSGDSCYTLYENGATDSCELTISEKKFDVFYWSAENSSGEIDILVERGTLQVPIEVKAKENLRSKSLRAFKEMHPKAHAMRFSVSAYRKEEWMENVSLWAVGSKLLCDEERI